MCFIFDASIIHWFWFLTTAKVFLSSFKQDCNSVRCAGCLVSSRGWKISMNRNSNKLLNYWFTRTRTIWRSYLLTNLYNLHPCCELQLWRKLVCYIDTDASKELDMFRLLVKQGLAPTFPNVEITLRIYLCLMVSNCSGERTFSRLKLIKNELRSTMAQKRMNVLSLMSIESDILRKIDFTCVVEDFALRKSRKVNVWKLLCIFNC